jgi:hypothetical protein
MKFKLFFTFILFSQSIVAQNYTESFYPQNPYNLIFNNPAFTGAFENPMLLVSVNPSTDHGYGASFGIDYQQYLDYIKGGIGISYNYYYTNETYSGSNAIAKSEPELNYSPTIIINNDLTLKPGLGIGEHYETINGWNNNPENFINWKAGLLLFGDHYYFGFAANHINSPVNGLFETIYPYYSLNAGYNICSKDSNKKRGLYFNAFYGQNSKDNEQVVPVVNSYQLEDFKIYYFMMSGVFRYKSFITGLSYTYAQQSGYDQDGSLIGMIGLQNKRFRFSFSATLITRYYSDGFYEILMRYNFHSSKHSKLPSSSIQIY